MVDARGLEVDAVCHFPVEPTSRRFCSNLSKTVLKPGSADGNLAIMVLGSPGESWS